MYHEAQLHRDNCFVTLTYDDEHLPEHASLKYSHVQKFLKRLRKKGYKFRYYAAGEYGDGTPEQQEDPFFIGRPHYHLCLFGINFHHDRYNWNRRKGREYYRSPTLEACWPHGFSDLSDFSYGAAAYVAQYVFKKRKGETAKTYAREIDGDLVSIEPEQSRMSLKPAIGHNWFLMNKDEIFPADNVVVNGTKKPVPEYYDKLWSLYCPTGIKYIKKRRQREAEKRDLTQDDLDKNERKIAYQNAQKSRNLQS